MDGRFLFLGMREGVGKLGIRLRLEDDGAFALGATGLSNLGEGGNLLGGWL